MDDQFSYNPSKVAQAVLNELASQSGLSQTEIAFLLGVDPSNLDQQAQDELSDLGQEFGHLLTSVLRHGLAIFDQKITPFIKWLKTPHPELACPQTGFFPEWPATPPPPLEEMTSFKPYDLMAYAIQRDGNPCSRRPLTRSGHTPRPFRY